MSLDPRHDDQRKKVARLLDAVERAYGDARPMFAKYRRGECSLRSLAKMFKAYLLVVAEISGELWEDIEDTNERPELIKAAALEVLGRTVGDLRGPDWLYVSVVVDFAVAWYRQRRAKRRL